MKGPRVSGQAYLLFAFTDYGLQLLTVAGGVAMVLGTAVHLMDPDEQVG